MTRASWLAIVHHELRLLGRSRAAWVVWIVLIAATVWAIWSGQRCADRQRATIARVVAADATTYRQIYADLDDLASRQNPRPALQLAGMAWYIFQPEGAVAPAPHLDPRRPEAAASEWVGARHVFLPPAPLAALATGQSDIYPYYARVTIRTRPVLVQSDELENPVNLLNGRFDLAFFLIFCWPLVVMPLIYNVLSEEREGGTLALVGSQPVSLRVLLVARLGTRIGLTFVVTCGALLATLAVVADLREMPVERLAASQLAIAGTAVFWTGVAAVLNLFAWRSAVNATVLTACWLVLVVVAPAGIDQLASTFAPVPSRVELINAIRDAGNLDASQLSALVTDYYEEHPDASPSPHSADVTAIRGLAQQDAVDRRIDPILGRYHAAVAHRQAIVDRLRFLSPPLLVYGAVLELAGTSTTRFRQFAEQIDHYHRDWRAYFSPLVHARALMTKAHYEGAPRFAFIEEPAPVTRWRVLTLIGTALVVGLGLLTLAVVRVSGTSVR